MAFGGHGKARPETAASTRRSGEAQNEGEGFEMGSSRGEGRDGAGAYEMVEMEGKEGG